MTTREANAALVRRMQDCFNTRRFDDAADLFTDDYYSHPLGTTGFEAGKDVWRKVVSQFPDMRVVADDILVDGDSIAVRSHAEGMTPDGSTPMLIEIFRVDNGRLAEMWGISEGPQGSALE